MLSIDDCVVLAMCKVECKENCPLRLHSLLVLESSFLMSLLLALIRMLDVQSGICCSSTNLVQLHLYCLCAFNLYVYKTRTLIPSVLDAVYGWPGGMWLAYRV